MVDSKSSCSPVALGGPWDNLMVLRELFHPAKLKLSFSASYGNSKRYRARALLTYCQGFLHPFCTMMQIYIQWPQSRQFNSENCSRDSWLSTPIVNEAKSYLTRARQRAFRSNALRQSCGRCAWAVRNLAFPNVVSVEWLQLVRRQSRHRRRSSMHLSKGKNGGFSRSNDVLCLKVELFLLLVWKISRNKVIPV